MDRHSNARTEPSQSLGRGQRREVAIAHPVAKAPHRQQGQVQVEIPAYVVHPLKKVRVPGEIDRQAILYRKAQAFGHGPWEGHPPPMLCRQNADLNISHFHFVALDNLMDLDSSPAGQILTTAPGSDDGGRRW